MNPDFSPIEYIGPRGKRRRWIQGKGAGGVLLLLLATGIAACFVRPLLPSLRTQQTAPNKRNKTEAIAELRDADTVAARLAAAALARMAEVEDESAALEGPGMLSADLVVKSYQAIGIDLSDLVRRDMSRALRYYPAARDPGNGSAGDALRHIPNLQRFFSRWGTALHTGGDAEGFEVGDIIVWELPPSPLRPVSKAMGIIVPGPEQRRDERWVVSVDGGRFEWTDELFSHEIVGHYRYSPGAGEVARLEMAGAIEQ